MYMCYVFFQPLPADKPVKMPSNVPITRVVIAVVEKFIDEDAIRITVEVWGCFVPGNIYFMEKENTYYILYDREYTTLIILQNGLKNC